MSVDWKEILASKVDDGTLKREDFIVEQEPKSPVPDTLQIVIDRKGRKGKTATIVEGFTCPDTDVANLAATLKSRLGTGGSARGSEILIQGDVADKVRRLLMELGYRVK